MENFINILTQITAGAFTGYITNTYAINMLFKEYKIFKSIKVGGVIIRTKDDFIDRISKLVERDIINYKTLGRELHKEDFEKTIENFVKDFFNNTLVSRLRTMKIKDLECSEESLIETEKFLKSFIDSNIEEARELVFRNITLNDLATPSQLSHTINNLIEKSVNRINENNSINAFAKAFIREKGHLSLGEIFQPSQELIENELRKIQQETPELIREIFASIDDDTLIRIFQYQLNKKKLGEIILPSARDNTLGKLKENIQDFLDSDEGILLINNLSAEIIKILKKTDKPIIELLTPDFRREAEEFLEKILPYFSSKIALWLRENSLVIEGLIQEGIEETIESLEGMRGMLIGMIKDSLLANIASKNNAAELIVDFIENKIDLKQVSEGITEEIITFLHSKSIKDIIISLENNGFLSVELISTQLQKAFSLMINSIDQESTEKLFNKTLGEVYTPTLNKDFFVQGISQALNGKIADILNEPLEKLIREENLPDWIFENADLINTLKNLDILNIKLKPDSKFKFPSKRVNLDLAKLNFQDFREMDVLPFLEKLNSVPEVHSKITQVILNQLHNNLPQALNGKIEYLVAENLSKLTPEQVSDVVHDFMGRELGPITKFGAILGGAAGLFLAVSGSGGSITSLSINPISLLIYGGVGVLTNVIALEMIFRPYKEQRFLNKIGLSKFSQGYIMKNKKTFGKNMGRFVEESLLERRMIKSRFSDLKPELAQDIKRKISADDFAIIGKIIAQNKDVIVSQLTKTIQKAASQNKEKLGCFIASYFAKEKVGELTGQDHKVFSDDFSIFLSEKFKEILSSNKSFDSLMPSQTAENLERFLSEKIEYFIENLDVNSLEQLILIKDNERKFIQIIKKPLSQWLKNEKMEELLFNPEKIEKISGLIKQKLEEPFGPQHTLGSILKGSLKNYTEKNIPGILNKIENFLIEMLNNNSQEIIFKTQKNIYNNLGFLQKGGYSLMGGDQLVEEIVEHIISAKLPPYIQDSKKEIEKILINTLEENVYTIKLKDIQKSLRDRQLEDFIEEVLSSEETKNNLLEIFGNLAKVPLENYLKVADLDTLGKIYKVFQDEIRILVEESLKELALWKKDVSVKASRHIVKTAYKSFSELSPEAIFSKNPHFYNLLEKETQTGVEFNKILISIWEEDLQKETIGNILSSSILAKDLAKILENLSNNEEIKKYLESLVKTIINGLIESKISLLHPDTKKDLADQVITAGLESFEKNLPDILSSVDFKKITEDEIDKMEGQDIHNLFKSFAGKYFSRLKLWGVIGALFGLHGGLSVLATFGYLTKKGEKNG